MTDTSIYKSIAERTNGDVYIGVVGPVRTGKSTFIKRFMETVVLPNIDHGALKNRAVDELPQSSAGRTIMTTEPKFIPEEAVKIELPDRVSLRVRMIDCVGYIVNSALGYIEDAAPRMIVSPWYKDAVPFNVAAETGTRKVIAEHSTIGIVVTTDGSISDIPRADYVEAEQRVVNELKELNKPFVVLLNCVQPHSEQNRTLAKQLETAYDVPVIPVSCLDITESEIVEILAGIAGEFPVKEVAVSMPGWVTSLEREHWLKSSVYGAITDFAASIYRMRDVAANLPLIENSEYVTAAVNAGTDLGRGEVEITALLQPELFYRILGEITGLDIADEGSLMSCIAELSEIRAKYKRVEGALMQVEATGYGIVMPGIGEMKLEEPEMFRQGGRYGVKLSASAPSIHMLRADINTEIAPVVGSEKQSEQLVAYLMNEFEGDPIKIWESNIFGKSLHELVNEGLQSKLSRMPTAARAKLQQTLERIINDGCMGLICIIF